MSNPVASGAPLVFYDSYTRSLRPFTPIDPANVRVYSCGLTVYNYAHLGNLRAYIFTDTLSRTLRWKGYPLTHIVNITDVGHLTSDADAGDDKMEAAAVRTGKTIWEIAEYYTQAFWADLKALNVRDPSRWPKATEHVPDMIEFARAIEAHCYEIDSGLYFDSTTVPDYGRLAGARNGDIGESRLDPVDGKRHPQDFAIWRKSAPGENRQMEWDSPWGRGAPGWHLECSVMSARYLGAQFDIHTGGIDHREIHHVNEIAQNQAHSGTACTGANWWMHNNFLVDHSGKMSKSKGGFSTLASLTDRGIHPLAYRLMCLSAHYRSELEFSPENLEAALTRLRRLVIAVGTIRNAADGIVAEVVTDHPLLAEFDTALSDDLNTPKALTVLDRAIADKRLSPALRLGLVARMDEALGLGLSSLSRADLRLRPASATLTEAEVETRVGKRKAARAAKDFATSDRIRDDLAAVGIEIMDGDPLGWDWTIPWAMPAQG